MKIKIFQHEDMAILEKLVNDWVDQHPMFKVIDIRPVFRPYVEHFEKREKRWDYLTQTILYTDKNRDV